MLRKALLLSLAVGLSACVQSDGPSATDVLRDARAADVPILRLTPEVIAGLGQPAPPGGFDGFSTRPFTPGSIQPGDVIAVRVFETGDDGVFSIANSSSLELGEFVVGPGGSVSVPFVGNIRVAGNTVAGAERVITNRLRETAIDPQATVNIQVSPRSSYSVQGAVGQGGVFPLSSRAERLLDALATAGGVDGDPESTLVTVRRGSQSGTATYATLLEDASQNVPIQPGDTVIVGGGEARYISDGALNSPGEFTFVEGELSLAQAVAQSGGLQDARADPMAVFVFRRQPPGESFRLLEVEGTQRDVYGDVIFRAEFDNPIDRLNAQDFFMRDGDILHVGNAPLAEFSRFFQVFDAPPEIPAPSER